MSTSSSIGSLRGSSNRSRSWKTLSSVLARRRPRPHRLARSLLELAGRCGGPRADTGVSMLPRRGRRRAPASGSRRVVLWLVAVVGGVLLLAGVASGVRLLAITRDLRTSRDLINQASADIVQGRLANARSELVRAQRLLVGANSRLYNSPDLEVIGWVPVVHQNLASMRTSVGVALRLVSGGNDLLTLTQPLENAQGKLEIPLRNGTIPLQIVQRA